MNYTTNYSIGLAKANSTYSQVVKSERRRATSSIRKQYEREVSFQIQNLKQAIMMAENPDMPDRSRLFEIYRYIKKDAHLKSQIKVAKTKVLSEPWLLYSADNKPNDAASQLFNKWWFNKVIEHCIEMEFEGFSVLELDGIKAATADVEKVTLIERRYISIERRCVLLDGTITGDYIPYADVMNDIDIVEFAGTDFGLLLECAYNIIWKYYSRSDYSRASEKFGMPILAIEADTNNDAELDDLEKRAAGFGTDGYIVTQKGDTASIIERSGQRMHDIYLDNMKYCDEQVSKHINGGTAGSDTKAFTGSAEVQERTSEDITSARLQLVSDEINRKFIPYLVAKGFPCAGLKMGYPSLMRARERRISGQPLPTDPKPAAPTADPKAESNPAPAKAPKKGGK